MFSTLRENSKLYILHKEGVPYIDVATVTAVSAPVPKFPIQQPFGMQTEMIVDLTVSSGGQTMRYEKLPANADRADFGGTGNMVLASSRDAMNAEVTAMKQKSLEIIGSVDYHKGVVKACDDMFVKLNPEIAEKQQLQNELNTLKGQFSTYAKTMDDLMKANKELLEQLKAVRSSDVETKKK